MQTRIKSLLTKTGIFAARQFPNAVMGYDLARDLALVVPKQNPLCFDVGANRGQTIKVLQDCFANPSIHAFEPSSATFAGLSKQSFGTGGTVSLHQLAFGEAVGQQTFHNYGTSELSSLLPLNRNQSESIFADQTTVSEETVSVDTLDHFCAERDITHIDLLKIDTQGYELSVLRGGASLLGAGRVSAVLLELNFSPLYHGQSDPLAVLTFLRDHKLRLVDFYEKERMKNRELSWTTALFMMP
ncbi:MAG: FkbM family methyltransferase [Spirosoma sp.]|nr:FkbM family methyltransferase [Spirosoma sp.]